MNKLLVNPKNTTIYVSEDVNWNECPNMINLITKIEIECADEDTKVFMEEKKKAFDEKHRTNNNFVFTEKIEIEGIEEEICFAKKGNLSFFYSKTFFLISVFMGFGAFYRIIFDLSFKDVVVKIVKRISRKDGLPNKTKWKYRSDFDTKEMHEKYENVLHNYMNTKVLAKTCHVQKNPILVMQNFDVMKHINKNNEFTLVENNEKCESL